MDRSHIKPFFILIRTFALISINHIFTHAFSHCLLPLPLKALFSIQPASLARFAFPLISSLISLPNLISWPSLIILPLQSSFVSLIDFDGDGYLSKEDLIDTIKCLCGEEELKPQEMQLVADKIIEVSGYQSFCAE